MLDRRRRWSGIQARRCQKRRRQSVRQLVRGQARPGNAAAQHGRRVAAAELRFLMQSRLNWTGQQKQSSAPVSFVVAWKHLRCGLRCGCGSGGGGLLFGFRVWGDFFIAGDREEPSTASSYLIQVRGTRGAAGICDVPGLGEFSGLPAPVTAAGQVFTGRQCSVAYTRRRRESTKRSMWEKQKEKNNSSEKPASVYCHA